MKDAWGVHFEVVQAMRGLDDVNGLMAVVPAASARETFHEKTASQKGDTGQRPARG